jgi:hypothetical protein
VITPAAQVELARGLGADVVVAEGPDAAQYIEAVRHFFGGGADTAIHVAGDLSVAAGVVRPGGKFTSTTDTHAARRAIGSGADYVSTIVVPNGHKLADLLFKVAAHRLHSHVGQTLSFDQVGDAVNPGSNGIDGRTVLVR